MLDFGRDAGALSTSPGGRLTTLTGSAGGHLTVLYGDRLDHAPPPPPQASAADLVAYTAGAFGRYCGVAVTDGTAVLFSDHGATCPLYHARDEAGNLLVGTSAAALRTVSAGALGLGPAGPRAPGDSGFAGVRAVPAGAQVTLPLRALGEALDGALPAPSGYHFRLPLEPAEVDPDRAVAAVRDALAEAMAEQLAGADSTGVLLSGGVDSSTVAALARERVGTLRTYTVGTPFGDEYEPAARFARWLGSQHHELMFTPDDLTRMLPTMIRLLESWDLTTLQIAAPACFLLEQLRGQESLLLTGYGSDLLFAGLGGSGSEEEIEQAVRDSVAATATSNEFSPAYAEAQGILVRHPYWTPLVIQTALSIRARLKLRDGAVKWVLRRAAAAVVPDEVANRPKLGIHEGTAMHRMFAAALGDPDPAAQSARIRELALDVFSGSESTAEAEGGAAHAGLAGVAS
jgi:carbapenam-3-carboxylate synthase